MYQTSLVFKIKDIGTFEKYHILEMFFKSWVDDICNNEVQYTFVRSGNSSMDICRVDFDNLGDAVALVLMGIPNEFKKYIEIVD